MYLQKNRKLYEFATANYYFLNRLFQTCIIVKRQSKPCTQIYLQFFFANCINLQLAIRILKNHAFRTCTTPLRTFRPILRSIGLLDIEIPQKEIISTDNRRTDGRTDGWTDGQTSRTTTIGSFFEKKILKNILKQYTKTKYFSNPFLYELLVMIRYVFVAKIVLV